MARITLLLLLIVNGSLLYAQKKHTDRLYVSTTGGPLVALTSQQQEHNFLRIAPTYASTFNINVLYALKNDFTINLGILHHMYSYSQESPFSINYIRYNTQESTTVNFNETSILTGIGYKINCKNLIINPYTNIGYVLNYTSGNFETLEKEYNSNNIIETKNDIIPVNNRFTYAAGLNFYYHFTNYFGGVFSLEYSRFHANLNIYHNATNSYQDTRYNYTETTLTENYLGIKIGFFFSLIKD